MEPIPATLRNPVTKRTLKTTLQNTIKVSQTCYKDELPAEWLQVMQHYERQKRHKFTYRYPIDRLHEHYRLYKKTDAVTVHSYYTNTSTFYHVRGKDEQQMEAEVEALKELYPWSGYGTGVISRKEDGDNGEYKVFIVMRSSSS